MEHLNHHIVRGLINEGNEHLLPVDFEHIPLLFHGSLADLPHKIPGQHLRQSEAQLLHIVLIDVFVVIHRSGNENVIVRVLGSPEIPVDEKSFDPEVADTTQKIVILPAFYPEVLRVSKEVSVRHRLSPPGTLGAVIFVQALRVTVSFRLSQSEWLPRRWLMLQHLAFAVFARFYNPSFVGV